MHNRLLSLLVGWVVICLLILAVILLSACSGDYLREKGGVTTDLHKYCLEYPKDSACQGKESK